MGRLSRTKGHGFEREIAALFRSMGWQDAATSRACNLADDAKGIDLQHTAPFQVQCKCSVNAANYASVLKAMPKQQGTYNVVFQRLTRKGTYVIMEAEDFCEILAMLRKEHIL